LRRAIEPVAAEIAATSRTPDGLARIADAFGRMERFRNGDGDLIGADVDFHVAILEATGNHFLAALGGLIQAALECSFRFTWIGAASIRDDRLEQHRGVLAAIDDGRPELARARMVELLNDSFDDMRKFRESRSRRRPPRRRGAQRLEFKSCVADGPRRLVAASNRGQNMFTIGIDDGANSVRALVVRCADGAEFGSAVVGYPSGDEGVLLDESDYPSRGRRRPAFPGTCDSPSAHAAP
jgi:hypothetical protein